MNIFEDLIDELKEDNLLEKTVVATKSNKNNSVNPESFIEPKVTALNEKADDKTPRDVNLSVSIPDVATAEKDFKVILPDSPAEVQPPNTVEVEPNQVLAIKKPVNKEEFFRRRAVDEVSFLQMVEHVFAGVEREQMKIVPKPYDALNVKKVLHSFLQVSKDKNSNEQAQAEFQLLQETENWYSTLTHRDKRISVNHLRRYCETARPSLSSPALVSLARFYRNSPYSEQVRGKFDFVVTRLFSKDVGNELREMAFDREELIVHIKELYAEWSSIPLYQPEDDAEILLIALKFEDFMTEAAVAENFDELIKNDFFNRLRLFKKDNNENFFSPLVVAANIESNLRIGNRYVELLDKEKANKAVYEDKYGFLHDQSISDATGKTFQLVELLSRKVELPKLPEPQNTPKKEFKKEKENFKETVKSSKPTNENKLPKETSKVEYKPYKIEEVKPKNQLMGISSWIVTAVIFCIISTVGIYIWANAASSEAKDQTTTKNVNLENSSLKETIIAARIENESFSATVLPAWNNLTDEKKEALLKKIISMGAEKGFNSVQLKDDQNKIVGISSSEKTEIYKP